MRTGGRTGRETFPAQSRSIPRPGKWLESWYFRRDANGQTINSERMNMYDYMIAYGPAYASQLIYDAYMVNIWLLNDYEYVLIFICNMCICNMCICNMCFLLYIFDIFTCIIYFFNIFHCSIIIFNL